MVMALLRARQLRQPIPLGVAQLLREAAVAAAELLCRRCHWLQRGVAAAAALQLWRLHLPLGVAVVRMGVAAALLLTALALHQLHRHQPLPLLQSLPLPMAPVVRRKAALVAVALKQQPPSQLQLHRPHLPTTSSTPAS